MKLINVLLVAVACTGVVGCVSQQSHERALQEYEKSQESTAVELERLQQAVEEKQTEVMQLQETKMALEHTVEVQDQIKEEQLAAVQQEVEALYTQIRKLGNTEGVGSLPDHFFGGEPVDFQDLRAALSRIRSGLDGQIGQVSHLREENSLLEKELSALEARLKEVERLKHELELVKKLERLRKRNWRRSSMKCSQSEKRSIALPKRLRTNLAKVLW